MTADRVAAPGSELGPPSVTERDVETPPVETPSASSSQVPAITMVVSPAKAIEAAAPMTNHASAEICELEASAKDQAELAMIVDLSRNDLARVLTVKREIELGKSGGGK